MSEISVMGVQGCVLLGPLFCIKKHVEEYTSWIFFPGSIDPSSTQSCLQSRLLPFLKKEEKHIIFSELHLPKSFTNLLYHATPRCLEATDRLQFEDLLICSMLQAY